MGDVEAMVYIFASKAIGRGRKASGKEPTHSKICINDTILERIDKFTYLGYKLSFLPHLDISEKIFKFNNSVGIINSIMKPSLFQKHIPISIPNYVCSSLKPFPLYPNPLI